jgi:hypothetical protein
LQCSRVIHTASWMCVSAAHRPSLAQG